MTGDDVDGRVLTTWTVYCGPDGAGGRVWWVLPWAIRAGGCDPEPVGQPVPAGSLPEARAVVPPGLYRLARAAGDDPTIVETWL